MSVITYIGSDHFTDVIADEVEEEVENIKPICAIAEKYAPNYDVDAIYEELSG